MSQLTFTSIPHLHAATHSQDLMNEARRARLIAQVRPEESDRSASGVRGQVGAVLIRVGEFVRGSEPTAKAA
jgi:hypothetical protein